MNFLHTGHIGDIIAFLPTMKAMGGGNLIIRNHNDHWAPMKGFRFDSVKPLLESQSYIGSVEYQDHPKNIDYDASQFRHLHNNRDCLLDIQAKHAGVEPCYDKWLDVEPDSKMKGRVIIARSPRYNNDRFPHRFLARKLGGRAVFVGTPHEHTEYEATIGRTIHHHKTGNLLDLAKAIAGCHLFIGNQSSPCWLAMGLHARLIQEVCDYTPDAQVPYDGARYVQSGKVLDEWID